MAFIDKLKNMKNDKSFDEREEKISTEDENKNEMDLVVVLDKSGSMWTSEEDIIGGFNSLIEKERKKHPGIYVTVVLFDTDYNVLYTRKPINEVDILTREEYHADGCTALLDAVGTTINRIDRIASDKVLFVIATDGFENSSTEFTNEDIKNMIKTHEWEFIYLGADVDAFTEARKIGIDYGHAANYKKSASSIGKAYNSVRVASNSVAMGHSLRDGHWKKQLEDD